MRHIFVTTAICAALATPLIAQNADTDEGFSLMEEGAKLLLRGLMEEIEPSVQDFQDLMEDLGPSIQGFVVEMGPRLDELLTLVDDLKYYGQPEILPNGDIIIRRDQDAPSYTPPQQQPDDTGDQAADSLGNIEL